jgi:hypothetical protein
MTRMTIPRKIQLPEPAESMQDHPDPRLLEIFLRGDLSGPACWSFGEFPADPDPDLVD